MFRQTVFLSNTEIIQNKVEEKHSPEDLITVIVENILVSGESRFVWLTPWEDGDDELVGKFYVIMFIINPRLETRVEVTYLV